MRGLIVIAAFATALSPVFAQPTPDAEQIVVKRGATVYDSTAKRIGAVLAVRKDGDVVIDFRSATVVLPAASVRLVGGKLVTSLSRAEVAKLD